MLTVYGIPNCDTVRKTRKQLESDKVTYRFHDFRKDGITKKQLTDWCTQIGWEKLLNKRGTTFRGLSDAEKENLTQSKAITLMQQHPALIKRPVIEKNGKAKIGL